LRHGDVTLLGAAGGVTATDCGTASVAAEGGGGSCGGDVALPQRGRQREKCPVLFAFGRKVPLGEVDSS
jgi:hypothetical protein